MRKLLSVGVALAFAVSLATVASAGKMASPAKSVEQARAGAPGKLAGAVKQAAPAKKSVAGKRTKRRQITGVVKAIDENAGTLTVQGRKGSVSLKAGEKGKLAKIQVGDKVLVNYTGNTASSVKKITAGKVAAGKK